MDHKCSIDSGKRSCKTKVMAKETNWCASKNGLQNSHVLYVHRYVESLFNQCLDLFICPSTSLTHLLWSSASVPTVEFAFWYSHSHTGQHLHSLPCCLHLSVVHLQHTAHGWQQRSDYGGGNGTNFSEGLFMIMTLWCWVYARHKLKQWVVSHLYIRQNYSWCPSPCLYWHELCNLRVIMRKIKKKFKENVVFVELIRWMFYKFNKLLWVSNGIPLN